MNFSLGMFFVPTISILSKWFLLSLKSLFRLSLDGMYLHVSTS